MRISELLRPGLIQLALQSEFKDELFAEMVQMFVSEGVVTDRETALRVLHEREKKMSTGIANGLALPHAKLPEATSTLLALGLSRQGIEYNSLDGEPVHVVFMIFAQVDDPGQHILVLAELSRLFSVPGFMGRIKSAKTPAQVLEIIRSEE